MDVTEIDLRGLRMAPDGVTAALATAPPPTAFDIQPHRRHRDDDRRAGADRRTEVSVGEITAHDLPTGHEFTTAWQLPAGSDQA